MYFARRSDVPDVDLPRELENRFFVVFSPLNYKDNSQNRRAVDDFLNRVVGSGSGASWHYDQNDTAKHLASTKDWGRKERLFPLTVGSRGGGGEPTTSTQRGGAYIPPNGIDNPRLLRKLKYENAPFYHELMDYAKEKNVPPPFFEEVGQGRWRVEFLRYNVYGEERKGALAIESSAKEFIRKYLPESYDRLTGKSPPHHSTSPPHSTTVPKGGHHSPKGISTKLKKSLTKGKAPFYHELGDYAKEKRIREPEFEEVSMEGPSNNPRFVFRVACS